MIFILRYYISTSFNERGYRLDAFISSLSLKDFTLFIISFGVLGFYIAFFYLDSFWVDGLANNSLQHMINLLGDVDNSYLTDWLSNILDLLLYLLPVVILTLWVIREKTGSMKLHLLVKYWRLIVFYYIIQSLFMNLTFLLFNLADGVVFDLIRIPFEENYIPGLFSGIVRVIIAVFTSMLFAIFTYTTFFSNIKEGYELNIDTNGIHQ